MPQEIMVTLANGTQVPWTEFRTWSASKQAGSVRSSEANNTLARAARATHTGKVISESQRQAIKAANTGRPSPLKGQKLSEETRAKMKGRVFSDTHRARLSAAGQGRQVNAETRAKQSQAALNRSGAGNNAKRIHTPFGVFDSAKIAAEKLGVAYCTIGRRTIKDPNNYYFL